MTRNTPHGQTEVFSIDRSVVRWSRIVPWLAIPLVLLFLTIPFWSGSDHPSSNKPYEWIPVYALSLIPASLFALLGWFAYREGRNLPHSAIAVDDDGLWPAHLVKERSVVRWEDIVSVRERQGMQRLDLVDRRGRVVLKLEYQLTGFERLRALVTEASAKRETLPLLPATFSPGPLFHTEYLLGVAFVAGLGWYAGQVASLLLLPYVAILAGLILYKYLRSVWKVVIDRNALQVHYALAVRRYKYDDIQSVEIGDDFYKGTRRPFLGVLVRGAGKPIKLKGLRVDSGRLYQVLSRAMGRHE